MKIRVLSEKAINRIAAGEVIERPISVVKELVENAIDAKSNKIDIRFSRGGRTLISVADNGHGIPKDELILALQRHATSKLKEEDLDQIDFFGFRGEALPSIAAVGILNIASKATNSDIAWEASSFNSDSTSIELRPTRREIGTTVELRDLFCFTPNRVRFLKSEISENTACTELIKKFILCFPDIQFRLIIDDKTVLSSYSSDFEQRLSQALGEEFINNSLKFSHEDSEIIVRGYAGLPTFNHALSLKQYYFVNDRSVKDKLISTAVKIAYADLLPNHRYPAILLFINCPVTQVDVNVHPTKAEVRFANENLIKKVIIHAIRNSLSHISGRQSDNLINIKEQNNKSAQGIKKFNEDQFDVYNRNNFSVSSDYGDSSLKDIKSSNFQNISSLIHDKADKYKTSSDRPAQNNLTLPRENHLKNSELSSSERHVIIAKNDNKQEAPAATINYLGYAIAQIENTYIIALTEKSEIIIVDQHAAHERVILERMKKQMQNEKVKIQHLLIPHILTYDSEMIDLVISKSDKLNKYGIIIERNGINQIAVTGMPQLLHNINVNDIFDLIISELKELNDLPELNIFLNNVYSNIACKNSIKAGLKLSIDEMDSLLRSMELTPFIEQCNHGRPTYIKINNKNLEKFFQRS